MNGLWSQPNYKVWRWGEGWLHYPRAISIKAWDSQLRRNFAFNWPGPWFRDGIERIYFICLSEVSRVLSVPIVDTDGKSMNWSFCLWKEEMSKSPGQNSITASKLQILNGPSQEISFQIENEGRGHLLYNIPTFLNVIYFMEDLVLIYFSVLWLTNTGSSIWHDD